MGYLIVFVIAAAVGVAVYAITLRGDSRPVASPARASSGAAAPPAPPPGGDYVPVTGWRPDWQSRLTGLLGLLLAVVLGAAGLAALLYVGGSMISRLLSAAG